MHQPTPKNLKICPFCDDPVLKWDHFLLCGDMPRKVRLAKEKVEEIRKVADEHGSSYGLFADSFLRHF